MNKQELIGKIKSAETLYLSLTPFIEKKLILDLVKQLDEPQPIKLKDVIARIKDLDVGAREVWLNEVLNELGSDYGTLKYKDGYEQGKLEGTLEREKVQIPQFAAEFITEQKKQVYTLSESIDACMSDRVAEWYWDNSELFARAWLDGYTVDEEKRYRVRIKGVYYNSCLIFDKKNKKWFLSSIYEIDHQIGSHTRKELEQAGFGWVFDCEGVEVEEVE